MNRISRLTLIIALLGEASAQVVHVGLGSVGVTHLAKGTGEIRLAAVQQAEVVGEVHGSYLP